MYLPKAFDPLMMEQEVVTPEELVAHFADYARERGLDPMWLYNSYVEFQTDSAERITFMRDMGLYQGAVNDCRMAWDKRQERLHMMEGLSFSGN